MFDEAKNCVCKTVFTTVITCQHTVQNLLPTVDYGAEYSVCVNISKVSTVIAAHLSEILMMYNYTAHDMVHGSLAALVSG